MSYQGKKLAILGGSFNLLPPVDKVPIGDYLLAQNWRVDQQGRLCSRYGYPEKFSISGGGIAHSAAIHGGINGDYYVGANTSIYFNFATAIATGLDGNRVGFAPMNGSMWVMNRNVQGSHNPTAGWQPWTVLTPPAAACVAAAGASGFLTSTIYTYTIAGSTYTHSLTVNGTVYSFVENGYTQAQLAVVIAALAAGDPNVSVTVLNAAAGTITITPYGGAVIAVSGSDGNASAQLAAGVVPTVFPSGAYQYYCTFETASQEQESNPGPASNLVTVNNAPVNLTSIPHSTATAMVGGTVNIYATGGTLGDQYLVGSVPNGTTTFQVTITDLQATDDDIVMPTTNDAAPACSGVLGPYFSRLIAWSSAANPNRLWWTDPDLPQYWPGAADPANGNWVDVGMDNEAIVWCTMHTNVLMIYKERSVWRLVGDPDTGTLEQVEDGVGLVNAWAVVAAGSVDYFVAPSGLRKSNLQTITDVSGNIAPLFTLSAANSGALVSPGAILPGKTYSTDPRDCYWTALGYAMGKLYIGYAEQTTAGTSWVLLEYHEVSGRWFYHRAPLAVQGFQGFLFDGLAMTGLTGDGSGNALGFNLDDFRGYYTTDPGGQPIVCVYQSHYEDAGKPDNQKVWLEVVIDYQLSGDTATVYVSTDNGAIPLTAVGTLSGTTRLQTSFALALSSGGAIVERDPTNTTETDLLAKTLSVAIECAAGHQVIIHNVYLYYYEEARLALQASSLPSDLGLAKVKQCKELMLDVDASGGACTAAIFTDLPGNALAIRQEVAIAQAGRAILKWPLALSSGDLWLGYLWRLRIGANTGSGPFRLYSVRLLMRAVGVFVEAYEAAAGFVWDSMEMTFESGLTHIPRMYAIALAATPIKRFREVSMEIDTNNGNVTVNFITDLPGNAQAVRETWTVNTGTAGRRFVRLPLPAGTNPPVEGRLCRIQISGTSQFILYECAVEVLAVGVYLEAYEAAGGAVYDSRQQDFGSSVVKDARELELDIETTGAVTVQLLGDLGTNYSNSGVSTSGRQKVLLPLTISIAGDEFLDARLLQLIISGTDAFRLYAARVRLRPYGFYLSSAELAAGALWDSTELDLGTQAVKQIRELEIEIAATGTYTVTVYTDLPGNYMQSRAVFTPASTFTRTKVQIPLPQGDVPDNYLYGRLVRVTITGANAFKLFGVRLNARPIGLYVETYEAADGAVWDSTPFPLTGSPETNTLDQVRVEMDTDGAAELALYTDIPGETMSIRNTSALTTGATARHWATVVLPAGIEARSARLLISSADGYRIYRAQVRSGREGRYLCAAASGTDALNTLEFDFSSEREKTYKKYEIDLRVDVGQSVTLQAITEQSGELAVEYSQTISTANGRMTLVYHFTPGIRGKLLRIVVSGGPARIYHLRVWMRPWNEPQAVWKWEDYPVEPSDVLPAWADVPGVPPTPPGFTWTDMPVPPTPAEWQWGVLPVMPTPPPGVQGEQWFWAKVLAVEETPDIWQWIDVPFTVQEP